MIKKLMVLFLILLTLSLWGVFSGGDGSINSPYMISNLDDLEFLSENDQYWGSSTNHLCFIQTANIDASDSEEWNNGEGFKCIGNYMGHLFYGNYDGGNYSISNLHIDRGSHENQALFGWTSGAELKNINLENCSIVGRFYNGCLVGKGMNTIISGCSVTGTVTGSQECNGGLAGMVNDSIISNCYSAVNVTGMIVTGGLIGNISDSEVTQSSSMSDVHSNSEVAGGFAGYIIGSSISKCYSQGDVSTPGVRAGGFVGEVMNGSTVSESFAECSVSGGDFSGGFTGQV